MIVKRGLHIVEIKWIIFYLKGCIDTINFFPDKSKLEQHYGYKVQNYVIEFFKDQGFKVEHSDTDRYTIIYWDNSQNSLMKSLKAELEASIDFQRI